jgi:hypothetical protein
MKRRVWVREREEHTEKNVTSNNYGVIIDRIKVEKEKEREIENKK